MGANDEFVSLSPGAGVGKDGFLFTCFEGSQENKEDVRKIKNLKAANKGEGECWPNSAQTKDYIVRAATDFFFPGNPEPKRSTWSQIPVVLQQIASDRAREGLREKTEVGRRA